MNRSNWEHVVIALCMQLLVAVPTGNWWGGALLGLGFFAGREIAQRKYRIARDLGVEPRDVPEIEALHLTEWSRDQLLDLIPATITVIGVAWLVGVVFR